MFYFGKLYQKKSSPRLNKGLIEGVNSEKHPTAVKVQEKHLLHLILNEEIGVKLMFLFVLG